MVEVTGFLIVIVVALLVFLPAKGESEASRAEGTVPDTGSDVGSCVLCGVPLTSVEPHLCAACTMENAEYASG